LWPNSVTFAFPNYPPYQVSAVEELAVTLGLVKEEEEDEEDFDF
jgi:hypothetical protein